MRTGALALALLCAAPPALAGNQVEERLSDSVRSQLRGAIADRAVPVISFDSGTENAHRWLYEMGKRLQTRMPDRRTRIEFLKTLHYEAKRSGLDPQMVLGLIQVESGFRKYAVSSAGARGFMQVMPFWIKVIGEPQHNLFSLRTNLRYGCVILRHYLTIENGDYFRALGRYNGSLGQAEYPGAVNAAWQGPWKYVGATSYMLRLPLRANAALMNWFYGFTPPERGSIVLGHRRVYILPSRLGLLFGGVLLILLMGSINYALSLGFALTFLLAGAGLAGMVQTTRNLARLAVQAGRAEPAFAGESALYRLALANGAEFDRPEILLRHLTSGAECRIDVPAADSAEAVLAVPALRRGWQPLGRVMLETRFPLGLFRAWSFVEPECRCLVYPHPEPGALPPHAPSLQAGGARAHAQGSDDFSGLRAHQPADSPRHVAWKSVARSDTQHPRGGDMLTKQFAGEAVAELWLMLSDLPTSLGLEARLSRLAGWVLAAERSGAHYGLRLPGIELAPARGDAHRSACLEALALYQPGTGAVQGRGMTR